MNKELCIMIAKAASVMYLTLGVGILLHKAHYQKTFVSFLQNSQALLIGGMIALFGGMMVVQYDLGSYKDWTMIIKVFGWVGLVEGVLLLVVPGFFKVFTPLLKRPNWLALLSILCGAGFGYFGFLV